MNISLLYLVVKSILTSKFAYHIARRPRIRLAVRKNLLSGTWFLHSPPLFEWNVSLVLLFTYSSSHYNVLVRHFSFETTAVQTLLAKIL
jgi:hypothetical protein